MIWEPTEIRGPKDAGGFLALACMPGETEQMAERLLLGGTGYQTALSSRKFIVV